MENRFKFRAWDIENKKHISDCDRVYHLLIGGDNSFIYEQCTGLKDKNGKLIYEGDIVDDGEKYSKIIFDKSCFCYDSGNGCYDDLAFYHTHCEIVGNIHKNPELLEEK